MDSEEKAMCEEGSHSESTDDDLPVLPYAGTSGWSGSSTSRERAEQSDSDGTTKDNQYFTLRDLRQRGEYGLTYKELNEIEGWEHGTSSGVLSDLHKVGKIERIRVRRHRCEVYVMPEFVAGRELSPFRPNRVHRIAPLLGNEVAVKAVEQSFEDVVQWFMKGQSEDDDVAYEKIRDGLLSALDEIVARS